MPKYLLIVLVAMLAMLLSGCMLFEPPPIYAAYIDSPATIDYVRKDVPIEKTYIRNASSAMATKWKDMVVCPDVIIESGTVTKHLLTEVLSKGCINIIFRKGVIVDPEAWSALEGKKLFEVNADSGDVSPEMLAGLASIESVRMMVLRVGSAEGSERALTLRRKVSSLSLLVDPGAPETEVTKSIQEGRFPGVYLRYKP